MMLTAQEQLRYNRQIILDGFGLNSQLLLKAASVLVVGAGGLGCPALLYLAAAGIGKIGIADFDVVEESNLQRQVLFSDDDLNFNKAIQAKKKLVKLNPFVEYETFAETINCKNAIDIISNYDVVIDGTDNFETRYMLNDACVLLNKPMVYGSVYKMEGQVSVFNFKYSDSERSGTYRCLFPKASSDSDQLNCSFVGVLGVLPGLIGTLQATEAIKLITGTGKNLSNRLLMIDAATMNFTSWNFSRSENHWSDFPPSVDAFQKMNYQNFCNNNVKSNLIERTEFLEIIDQNEEIQILDVREEIERNVDLFPRSVKIPLNMLNDRSVEINNQVKTIIVCATGVRSELAIKVLSNFMDNNLLFSLKGGLRSLNLQESDKHG